MMILSDMSFAIMILSFFVVAFLYASVGLGGGSSYTAILSLFGVSYLMIPTISLTLNLLVTTTGSFNFLRYRHGRWKLILPFLVSSIPLAYLGGGLSVPKILFYWLLFLSLLFVVIRIYFWQQVSIQLPLTSRGKVILAVTAGAILGFIAGVVGIGGGVYLVPLILVLGLGSAKEAAACGSIFVWLNSLAGLLARLQNQVIDYSYIWPLMLAVLAGGYLGSWLGASRLSARRIETLLGLVIVIAIVFLLPKLFLG